MRTLALAPMLVVSGALAVAMALCDKTGSFAPLMFSPLFAAGLSLCSWRDGLKGQWPLLLLVSLTALACSARIMYVLTRPDITSRPVKTDGVVSLVRPWGRRSYAAVVDTPEGGFLLKLPFATLTEGMRLRVEGTAAPMARAKRPGGFDEYRYWNAHGASARLLRARTEILPPSWNIHRLRYSLYRALTIYMPRLTGEYLSAAWTGRSEGRLMAEHRAWGTSHILAVSGFHVGIAVLCASMLFGGNTLVLSLLMWGYVLLTGAAPSSVRAGLMLQVALLAKTAGRPPVPLNSVSLAASVMLCWSPFLFWDAGWRLSVLSAMTITAMYGSGMFGKKRRWLLVSPLIALVTFPQAAHTFSGVPAAGLALNLIAPAFFAAAFPAASLAAALRLTGAPFADLLLTASEGGFHLWGELSGRVKELVPWTVPWGPFTAWLSAGMFFFLICRFLRLPAPRTWIVMTAGAFVSFWLFPV